MAISYEDRTEHEAESYVISIPQVSTVEEVEEYFYLTLNSHYTNTGHHGNKKSMKYYRKKIHFVTNKQIGPGDSPSSKTITVAIEEPPKCGIKQMHMAK